MCKYCNKPNKTILTHILGVSAFVGKGRLFLRFEDVENNRTIVNKATIKYCPMCGHEFKEAKK